MTIATETRYRRRPADSTAPDDANVPSSSRKPTGDRSAASSLEVAEDTARRVEPTLTEVRRVPAADAVRTAAEQLRNISFDPTAAIDPYFIDGLEKWEGVVDEVFAKAFSARVRHASADGIEEYTAEFEKRLIPRSDVDLLVPGGTFYMTVRTVLSSRGKPTRTARIVMRRLGVWSSQEVEAVSEQVAQLADRLRDVI
jgi:hypothetical protein